MKGNLVWRLLQVRGAHGGVRGQSDKEERRARESLGTLCGWGMAKLSVGWKRPGLLPGLSSGVVLGRARTEECGACRRWAAWCAGCTFWQQHFMGCNPVQLHACT